MIAKFTFRDQNKKVRLRTTRLYCERCEIFDSHDTEDCPEKPESPKVQRRHRVVNDGSNKNAEEPFCVCCDSKLYIFSKYQIIFRNYFNTHVILFIFEL